MSDDGAIGYGAEFWVRSGTAPDSAWFKMGLITNITPPSDGVDDVEITHMESPGRKKQFTSGLSDPGEMNLDLNYMPGNDTDEFILGWRRSGETRESKIVYPTTASLTDTFPSYVKSYTPTIPVGEKMTASLGLKVAGDVVRSGSVS